MAHTITPWRTNDLLETRISGADGIGVAQTNEVSPRRTYDESVENAAHIVRCVNAHDALVAALEHVTSCLAWHTERHGVAMDAERVRQARAALALAKGE